ncbi:hypothetical protein [Streptococcus pluranimalium]
MNRENLIIQKYSVELAQAKHEALMWQTEYELLKAEVEDKKEEEE